MPRAVLGRVPPGATPGAVYVPTYTNRALGPPAAADTAPSARAAIGLPPATAADTPASRNALRGSARPAVDAVGGSLLDPRHWLAVVASDTDMALLLLEQSNVDNSPE